MTWLDIWTFVLAVGTFIILIINTWRNYKDQKNNRKSATLIKLRLEELKELREAGFTALSIMDAYININADPSGKKSIPKNAPFKQEIDLHFTKIQTLLYRDIAHSVELSTTISTIRAQLINVENTIELVDIQIETMLALEKYSKIEYEDIEKYI